MSDRNAGTTSPADLLAEEIRQGIDEAPGSLEESLASSVVERAERFIVPAVEPGASFPRLKKLLLRVLRVATRSQGTFNAIAVEGLRELQASTAALERETTKRNDVVRRLQEESSRLRSEMERVRHEYDIIQARFSVAERASRGAASESGIDGARTEAESLPQGFYLRFEEEFRGPETAIRDRQREYAEFFRGTPGPVLDCGCGRGEFLGVLKAAGVTAFGVDSNRIAVEMAVSRGVDAREADAFATLRSFDGRLGGISALQVVEHLDPPAVYEFLELGLRALAPGGRLLVETINPDSLYALRAYRLDPTHRWPVPAATLDLMAREVGFESREIRWMSPVPEEESLAESSENDRKVNRWLFAPQDYALMAARPR